MNSHDKTRTTTMGTKTKRTKQPLLLFHEIPRTRRKNKHTQILQKTQTRNRKNHEFSYKLPTWKTFETWAYLEEWVKRKEAYQKYQNELLLDKIQQSYLDDLEEIFSLNQSITKEGLGKAKAILSDDKFSGFNFEKVMKGTDIAIQNNRLVTGEPTEIIKSDNKNDNDNTLEIVLTTPPKESDEDESGDGVKS